MNKHKQKKMRDNAKIRSLHVKLKKLKKRTDFDLLKEAALSEGKVAAFNSTTIFFGALISSGITLWTYESPEWTGFIALLVAAILVVFVTLLAAFRPNMRFITISSVIISSFLSVVSSIDLIKIISNLVLFNKYGDTPMTKVPSIFIDNATFSNPYYELTMSITILFFFLFFNSLSVTYFRNKKAHTEEIAIKEKYLVGNEN